MKIQNWKTRNGFTLVEIVVAVGLVALLLTGVMGLMGVSASRIDKSVAKVEAKWVVDAFVEEMSVYRSGAETTASYDDAETSYTDAYSKAYEWATKSNSLSTSIAVFKTNVSMTEITPEGRKAPVSIASKIDAQEPIPGVNYTEEYRVRRLGANVDANESRSGYISGGAYLLRLRPYLRDTDGNLKLGDYGDFSGTWKPDGASPDIKMGNMFMVQAEVYQLKSISANNGNLSASVTDLNRFKDQRGSIRPIFKTNVAFRR